MTMLQPRPWVPEAPERYVQSLAERVAARSADEIERDLLAYVAENRAIHERDCINLNPATNVMNPKAEALLAAGLGSRPSLGYPGDKYEMGLEGDREDRGDRGRAGGGGLRRALCRDPRRRRARSPTSTPSW